MTADPEAIAKAVEGRAIGVINDLLRDALDPIREDLVALADRTEDLEKATVSQAAARNGSGRLRLTAAQLRALRSPRTP